MKNEVQRVLKFRIYPNKSQREILNQGFNASVEVYNRCLEMKKKDWDDKHKLYEESGSKEKFGDWLKANDMKILSVFEVKREIKNWRKETPWLEECSSQLLHQAALNLDRAYRNFFRRVKQGEKPGFPKFKSKRDSKKSCAIDTAKIDWKRSLLSLPKFSDPIKIRIHRREIRINKKLIDISEFIKENKASTKTVTLSINPSGEYYAAINITIEGKEPNKKTFNDKNTVGIDLGTIDFATFSDGRTIKNPKHFKKLHSRLARSQRLMAKKKKGSANYIKQKNITAKLWQKICNLRNDFLHKTSHDIIFDKKINAVALETLDIQGLLQKNKYLANTIADASWFNFKRQMEYKATREGKSILSIDRYEATTSVCSCCGFILEKKLALHQRVWDCPDCGTSHKRDVNSAKLIKQIALSDEKDKDLKSAVKIKKIKKITKIKGKIPKKNVKKIAVKGKTS